MTLPVFDEMEVRIALSRACHAVGGETNFARLHNLPEHYIIAARKGEANLSYRLLDALGFEPVRRYVKNLREPSLSLHAS